MNQIRKWLFGKQNDPNIEHAEIDPANIPEHVAIIMDGNGRWAKQQGLPRVAGHHSGMKNVKSIAKVANRLGVKVLTLYAFSTENWKRPKDEVDFLMKLPQEFFPKEINELIENNIRIRMMGYKDGLPDYTLKPVEQAIEKTKNNTGMILNFAMNYGSRREIVQGMQELARDVLDGKLSPEDITEQHYASYLLTKDLPDPDLLIRTSGELRISNFMLWQLAYTELWFTDVYWPGFKEEHFLQAIQQYQCRARRFGALT